MTTILSIRTPEDEKQRKVTLYVDVATAVLVRQVARHERKSVGQIVYDMADAWIRGQHPDWEVLTDKPARKKTAAKKSPRKR